MVNMRDVTGFVTGFESGSLVTILFKRTKTIDFNTGQLDPTLEAKLKGVEAAPEPGPFQLPGENAPRIQQTTPSGTGLGTG